MWAMNRCQLTKKVQGYAMECADVFFLKKQQLRPPLWNISLKREVYLQSCTVEDRKKIQISTNSCDCTVLGERKEWVGEEKFFLDKRPILARLCYKAGWGRRIYDQAKKGVVRESFIR
jgi:hypothetical protein